MHNFDKENVLRSTNGLKTDAKVYRPSIKAQELAQFLSKTQPIVAPSSPNF